MFDTAQTMQSGQSFTLEIHKAADGRTTVSCPSMPEVGEVTDEDGRFAVQQMKRLLDDHVHRGYQPDRTPLVMGRGALLDE